MEYDDTLAIIFSCFLYIICCMNCYKCLCSKSESESESENNLDESKKQKLIENEEV